MSTRTFTCEGCGSTFLDETPEEVKLREFKKNFPETPEDEKASLCEDCYHEFLTWFQAQSN